MLNDANESSLSAEVLGAIDNVNAYLSDPDNNDISVALENKDILDDFNNSGDCD